MTVIFGELMNFHLATSPTHPHRVEDVRIHIHSICCDANAAGQQLALAAQLSKRGSNSRVLSGNQPWRQGYPAWWTNIAMENGYRNSGFSH